MTTFNTLLTGAGPPFQAVRENDDTDLSGKNFVVDIS